MAPNDIAFDVLGLPTETEESTDETRPEGAFEVTTGSAFDTTEPGMATESNDETSTSGEAAAEYTIDDLAASSRVPSRTIRFYQSKGLLEAPTIKGRVAFYDQRHVERLALIAQLQDRGLRIEAIRELVKRIDEGDVDVGEWLGLEAQLKAPWANDRPRTVTEEELIELTGEKRPGLLGELVRAGLAKREGSVYLLPSPGLLHVALKLEEAGVELEVATEAVGILRKHLAKAAEELTQFFFKHATNAEVRGADFGRLFSDLRPVGLEAVRLVFGHEVERVLRELVASGKTTKLPAKKKGR